MANHSDPESCAQYREVQGEALTGETDRPAIEPRNHNSGMPTLLSEAEGDTRYGDNRKPYIDPTRSETLSMSGSLTYGSSEVSAVSEGGSSDRAGKVNNRKPAIYAGEKSDTPIVPEKLPNNELLLEAVEGRGVAKGNTQESPAGRAQNRETVLTGLERIRECALRR